MLYDGQSAMQCRSAALDEISRMAVFMEFMGRVLGRADQIVSVCGACVPVGSAEERGGLGERVLRRRRRHARRKIVNKRRAGSELRSWLGVSAIAYAYSSCSVGNLVLSS